MELATKAKITWCPGCPNATILVAYRNAVTELVNDGKLKIENLVSSAGIGCHGKITDYLNTNTFEALHGRVISSATGIKIANPNLNVVAFTGDGDSLSEGFTHLLHAAERNVGISVFLHNNETFALTTGQATFLSPKGFKGPSTPAGSIDEPMNPLHIMLAMGATFVARTYALNIPGTKNIMKAAMEHKGFAFVEIIQPCITFLDTREHYNGSTEWLPEDFPRTDLTAAINKVREVGEKTTLGIFYQVQKPTFEEKI
ncbi:MAG: thiamine pyrophosphate-dependent enzyme [Candidatus Parcubacteria bacterium]|nr:thiamine pyrophosphate-dependent enzyme [Candidatus Parcubacteria bacterium]